MKNDSTPAPGNPEEDPPSGADPTRRHFLAGLALMAGAAGVLVSRLRWPGREAAEPRLYAAGSPTLEPGESGALHSLRYFGARLGADSSPAFAAAMQHAQERGGICLEIPATGVWRTTEPIRVLAPNVCLVGPGARNVQNPIPSFASEAVPGTILADHDGDAVLLSHAHDLNGFRAERITLAKPYGTLTGRAFAFDLGGAGDFRRDFVFRGVTITGFDTAFALFESSPERGDSTGAMGVLRILESNIMHNRWIARTENGKQWNGFVFERNDAGQNGYQPGQGGIWVAAHNVSIQSNILEGQRDPVILEGFYRSLVVKNNYFEANVGRACIHLRDSAGPIEIGPNSYFAVTTEHKVLLENCGRGLCLDPYHPLNALKISPSLLGAMPEAALNNETATPYIRSDPPETAHLTRPAYLGFAPRPSNATEGRATLTSPYTGQAMVGYSQRFGGSPLTYAFSVTGAAGQWVVLCWLLRRMQPGGEAPYVAMRVNDDSDPALGSHEGPLYYHQYQFAPGEWSLITAAVKLRVSMSRFAAYLWPYGVGDLSGSAQMRLPSVYVVNDLNQVRPFAPHQEWTI